MMLGLELPMISILLVAVPEVRKKAENIPEFVMNLEKRIQDVHQTPRTHIQGKHQHQRVQHNKHTISSKY